ncbi:MAG: nucleotidyltransferase domain-containing protein [Candidatus Saccharibacteria bacterium]
MTDSHIITTEKLLQDIKPVIDYYKKPEVAGILLYGSWGRGEQLPHSDVDIAVICNNKHAVEEIEDTNWEINDYFVEPTKYDYEYLFTQSLPERMFREFGHFWTEDTRFNWQQSKILYDQNDIVKQLLAKKAYLPAKEAEANLNVIIIVIERLLNYHLPRYVDAEKYVEAQILLNGLVNHVVHYIYNKNGLLLPYSSALFYWFDKKDLLGKQSVLNLFSNTGLNKDECLQRMKLFWEVCNKLGIKLKIRTQKEYLQYFFELNGTKKWEDYYEKQ